MSTSKDTAGGAGSPSAVSENPKAASHKETAISRARGQKKPASQARKHTALTRFPVPKSTIADRKSVPNAKESVSTLDKAKQPATAKSLVPRPGQSGRVLGGKPGSKTRSTVSSRIAAPTAPRKPTHLKYDAQKWKIEYNKLLGETQNTGNEQDKPKRDLETVVAELNKSLAASESRCEQAELRAATLAEEVVATRVHLDLSQLETRELKAEKDRLSAQVTWASGMVEGLQSQANLAGELQTELNSLRNVRVPSLEQENKALKQELRRVLDDDENPCPTLDSTSSLTRGPSEAFLNFLEANEVYIDQLEKTCGWFEKVYTDVVIKVEGLENHIAALQGTTGYLKDHYNDFVFGNDGLSERSLDPPEETRVLRITNVSLNTELVVDTVSTASTASTASASSRSPSLEDVVAVVPTESSSPRDPDSVSSKTGLVVEVKTRFMLDSSSTISSAVVQIEPSSPRDSASTSLKPAVVIEAKSRFLLDSDSTVSSTPETHLISSVLSPKPQAPLDQDLLITINIEPTAAAKLSLLERLTSITTKGTSFKINGPAEIAKALANGMEDAQARAKHNEAQVMELQKMMWHHVSELERMKKSACSMIEHRTLTDQLAAMEARLSMQDMLLADNGRQLAQFKKKSIAD